MSTVRTILFTALVASTAFALPAPQATSDSTAVSDLHVDVTCGCWNICTLQQFASGSTTVFSSCDDTCDPRFACETYEAIASTVPDATIALTVTGTTEAKIKRHLSTGTVTAHEEFVHIETKKREAAPEPHPMLPAKCVCVTSPCPCDGSDNSLNFKEKRDSGVGVNNGVTSGDSGVVMKDKRDYGSGTGVNNGLTTDEEGTLPFMEKRKANVEITISVTIKF